MIEDVVETDVGIDDLIEFVVVNIFVDFDEDPFQVFQFVRRDPFSCQAGCQFFQICSFKKRQIVIAGQAASVYNFFGKFSDIHNQFSILAYRIVFKMSFQMKFAGRCENKIIFGII